jgi:Uma2 family endonuclease
MGCLPSAGALLPTSRRRAYAVVMPLAPEYFTADMVRALPEDGRRHEVVHGELLVTPAPTLDHQRIVRRLLVALDAYCTRTSIGEAFDSPADISWDQDTLVQPDVFVVVPAEASARGWSSVRTLLLVAEVLSPSTAHSDRFKKRRLYQEQGVGLIWLVDPVRRIVEIWTPASTEATVATDLLRWEASSTAEPLVIHLADLFA